MRRILLFTIIFSFFFKNCTKDTGTNINIVQDEKGNHFSFVLHDGLSQNIVGPIQKKLEDNYKRILGDLEVDSMEKVDVKIWDNEKNFLDDMESVLGRRYTGATGWVYNSKDIRILYRGNAAQTVLHEFCHSVTLVVNNRIANNPRWLWEAVAIYEAGEFVNPETLSYLVNRNFPSLSELNSDFQMGENKIYSVGYLLSEYIIANWGKKAYVELIKMNGSIQYVIKISTSEFEEGWKKFVIKKYFDNNKI